MQYRLLNELGGETAAAAESTGRVLDNPGWLDVLGTSDLLKDERKLNEWYREFLIDCPQELMTKEMFNTTFSIFYNERKANLLTKNVFATLKKPNLNFLDYIFILNMLFGSPKDRLTMSVRYYLETKGKPRTNLDKTDARLVLSFVAGIYKPGTFGDEQPADEIPIGQETVEELYEDSLDLCESDFIVKCLSDPVLFTLLNAKF